MDIEEQKELAFRWAEGGYRLKTKKGANFVGHAVTAYYNEYMKHWGVVIIAADYEFAGTAHVYPVNQLEPA